MSIGLLEKVSGHLKDAGLMMGFADKYYSWSDADVAGAAGFILFQMNGTSGIKRYSTVARCSPIGGLQKDKLREGNGIADAIFANFAGMTKPAGILKFEPIGQVMGPYFLDNGRGVLKLLFVVLCRICKLTDR